MTAKRGFGSQLAEAARIGAAPLIDGLVDTLRAIHQASVLRATLDVRLQALQLEQAKHRFRGAALTTNLVLLVLLAAITLMFDANQLSPFALALTELIVALRPHPQLLAALMSMGMLVCDVAIGHLSHTGEITSGRRAVLIAVLLAVPTSITLATAVARWGVPGPMAWYMVLATIGLTLLTLALHAGLIGLACSGVAQWSLYRSRYFWLARQLAHAQAELDHCIFAADRARVEYELGVPDVIREQFRPMVKELERAAGAEEPVPAPDPEPSVETKRE